MNPFRVAIVIFDEVEILDFCGPYEVFGVTGEQDNPKPFEVFTVAEKKEAIAARNGLSVNPQYNFDDCPPAEILLIPGGRGTRRQMRNPELLSWIQQRNQDTQLLLSVCTGALVSAIIGTIRWFSCHHSSRGNGFVKSNRAEHRSSTPRASR